MRFKYLFLLLLSLLVVTSCKHKKEDVIKDEYIRPASITFTKQDTVEIMNQVNNYVSAVKSKDYHTAVQNLYALQGRDSVRPLTEDQKEHAMGVYNHFNIYDCEVNAFALKGESENMVKVALQIIKDGDIHKGIGVTYVKLRPVKFNGKWYITLMDNDEMRVNEER